MNRESEPKKSRNKWIYMFDVVLLVILLGFLIFAKLEGYYNKTYLMVNICDEPAQILEANSHDFKAFEQQIQNARATVRDKPDTGDFMSNLTWQTN